MTEGLKTDPHQPVYIGHLTPSPDGHSPYTATRHRGRGLKVSLQIFETPPLPCPVALRGVALGKVSRSDGGAGNSISSVGLCRAFNPLALWALPLYSLTGTQGERLRSIPFSPLLRFYEVHREKGVKVSF